MNRSPDYDVIVVGAGHNGLAATALLAGRGLRVLCLEKNAYVGGMAGTREILAGCRNDVGASLLFPLAKGLAEELELARYGVELIDLPIMASNLNSASSPPANTPTPSRTALRWPARSCRSLVRTTKGRPARPESAICRTGS